MQITKEQNDAVSDLVDLIAVKVGNEKREIDPIEAIATSARLAGSLLFRSFNFDLKDAKPGSFMISEEANTKCPELINITFVMLQNFGVSVDDEKVQNGAKSEPKLNFLEAINLVQNEAIEIMKKYNLSFEQLAQSTAIATSFIIEQSKNTPSEIGFGTAIYHYIEGSKIFPPAFVSNQESSAIKMHQSSNDKSSTKPWWKLW